MQNQLADKEDFVKVRRCPVCGAQTNYVYGIEDVNTDSRGDFYRCQCGIVFQGEYPEQHRDEVYGKSYEDGYYGASETCITHALYTYANVIEELTYGRTMLDVGCATPRLIKEWERRGWITYGIDINKEFKSSGNLFRGDFETYDFNIKLTDDLKEVLGDLKLNDRKFDMLWMSHVVEHFRDPKKALQKAYDLLSPTGVLYIACPDADFIFKTGVQAYPHWKPKEHYLFWTESTLCRELERIGFNIILKRRNFSSRYISWYDIQIIAQKKYF